MPECPETDKLATCAEQPQQGNMVSFQDAYMFVASRTCGRFEAKRHLSKCTTEPTPGFMRTLRSTTTKSKTKAHSMRRQGMMSNARRTPRSQGFLPGLLRNEQSPILAHWGLAPARTSRYRHPNRKRCVINTSWSTSFVDKYAGFSATNSLNLMRSQTTPHRGPT